jgi:hypothetical protein
MKRLSMDPTMTQNHIARPASQSSRLFDLLGWCLVSLPVIALAITSIRTSVNIPFEDDYGIYGIAEFLELWVKAPTHLDKLKWFAASQHVQYKLFFMHAVELIQYYCIGSTNYRALQLLGDATLLGVPLVLWFLLARSGRPRSQRIWLFIVPCVLFLSPRYTETINWALSGLQNIAVIPFAIASIFFITATWSGSFAWSIVFLVLSIATSGNGFFVAFVLLYFLLRSRRFAETLITIAVCLLMALLYAYRYHFYMVNGSVPFRLAIERKIIFPFVFLGAAGGSRDLAVTIGLALLIGFVVLARKGWERACPGSFGAALFCLVTTAGVTLTRSNGGVLAGLMGRYVMYGLLLACLEYLAILRLFAPQNFKRHPLWITAIAALGIASMILCALSEVTAYRQLQTRRNLLVTHLILWERHPERLVLIPDEDPQKQNSVWMMLRRRFQDDLRRQVDMGLYHPPYSAQDALPVRPHSQATIGIEDEQP